MLHDAAHALLLELGLLPAACGVTELGPGGLLRFDCSALQPRLIRWMRPQALRGVRGGGAPRRPASAAAAGRPRRPRRSRGTSGGAVADRRGQPAPTTAWVDLLSCRGQA
jgi:hypothetical protein